MAFLDNSGDIILDAVLTETGRVRLSQGQFQIRKFAFGDDEIDYALYDKNHKSGSAYSDLQILQTPIFEAATMSNANINYGLLSLTRNDILYMPTIVPNELVDNSCAVTSSVYYLAANKETNDYLNTAFGSSNKYNLQQGATSGIGIFVESGLNTPDVKGTSQNRNTYLIANNMLDSTFGVDVDNRFVTAVFFPGPGSIFSNTQDGSQNLTFPPLEKTQAGSTATGLQNYQSYVVAGAPDTVYYYSNNTQAADTATSALRGPRGSALKLNFEVDPGLLATYTDASDPKYTQYGKVQQNLFGDGNTYDYIDSTVYITGRNSSAKTQLRVRIIRTATVS